MPYFYILYSQSLDRYYVGSTRGDLEGRLYRHLIKHRGYTSRAKDWTIVYREVYANYEDALQREIEVKRWKSRKKILFR